MEREIHGVKHVAIETIENYQDGPDAIVWEIQRDIDNKYYAQLEKENYTRTIPHHNNLETAKKYGFKIMKENQ